MVVLNGLSGDIPLLRYRIAVLGCEGRLNIAISRTNSRVAGGTLVISTIA